MTFPRGDQSILNPRSKPWGRMEYKLALDLDLKKLNANLVLRRDKFDQLRGKDGHKT